MLTLLVLFILWQLKVPLTWPVFLLLFIFYIAMLLIMHRLIIPNYRRRTTTGREGLIGAEGTVIEPLKPSGLIKVKDEYWNAESLEGDIDCGEHVTIAELKGLVARVKRLEVGGAKRYDSNNTSKF